MLHHVPWELVFKAAGYAISFFVSAAVWIKASDAWVFIVSRWKVYVLVKRLNDKILAEKTRADNAEIAAAGFKNLSEMKSASATALERLEQEHEALQRHHAAAIAYLVKFHEYVALLTKSQKDPSFPSPVLPQIPDTLLEVLQP